MKIFAFECFFIDFLKKHKDLFFLIFITISSIMLRITLFNFQTSDYIYCLRNWFGHYQHYGINGIRFTIGDYNCIYNLVLAFLSYIPINSLYSIKIFSIIFDFVCAIYAYKLIYLVTKKKKLSFLTYGIVLFLPTFILNSSAWAQCDSIYTAFAFMSIYYLIKEKYFLSFITAGFSFAFKLQFVFILPLFIIYYFVSKKFSAINFFIIPLVNLLCALPSIIFGRNAREALLVYYNQSKEFSNLVMKLPNIYQMLPNEKKFGYFGIVITLVIMGCLLYYCVSNIKKISYNQILLLSVYSVVIFTYFLPYMHERYMFMADILSVIWFMSLKKKKFKYFIIPFCINMTSLYTYVHCIFNKLLVGYEITCIFYLMFVLFITYITLNELKNIEKDLG